MMGATPTVPGPNPSRPASDFETRNPHTGRTKSMGLDTYNVVVVGEEGIVTAMKGLSQRELGNRAQNYGWSGYP